MVTSGQEPVSGALADLATQYGVGTGYDGYDGRRKPASRDTVRAALAALGVEVDSDEQARSALEHAHLAPWRALVPPTTVVTDAASAGVDLRVPESRPVEVALTTESGTTRELPPDTRPGWAEGRTVDGVRRADVHLPLPGDLEQGYHRLTVRAGDLESTGHLIVAPWRCPLPPDLPRSWGWMLQLYALQSRASWGIGDLADLRALLTWSARRAGQFAVVNPLHAQAPVTPVEPSPYYPSSRRFHDPLYLRVDEVPEVDALDPTARNDVLRLAGSAQPDPDRIDRDAVLAAKLAALEHAFAAMPAHRREALDRYAADQGSALTTFATFCAIAEVHGTPFRTWPAKLQHPANAAVGDFRDEHAGRVAFHAWLQMLCDEQLERCQRAATDAGMRLGVVHDLAVGVDPGGADAWALQDELGLGVTVGAPPDAFNQQGQDWSQPPLLPNRLADTGFAPFRDMLRAVLRHAGGLRIDHVMGLFRLFWIPEGMTPDAGTYVRYPSEQMLGVLALEAHRAGAVVVGEDLGTVEPGVRETLADRQVLGSAVLYFERAAHDDREAKAPADYPANALASVSTHDLPTAAGWWRGDDVQLRVDLGLLGPGVSAEDEWASKDSDRQRLLALLEAEGLADEAADVEDLVVAMHALLARTPSLLAAASISDAIGDVRQPNMPGTVTAYPNWRLPLAEPADGQSRTLTLEEILDHPLLERVVDVLRQQRPGG